MRREADEDEGAPFIFSEGLQNHVYLLFYVILIKA